MEKNHFQHCFWVLTRPLLRGWRTPFCDVVIPMRVRLGTRFSRLTVPLPPPQKKNLRRQLPVGAGGFRVFQSPAPGEGKKGESANEVVYSVLKRTDVAKRIYPFLLPSGLYRYVLLTKREVKMAGYWPILFCVFMDLDFVSVHKDAKSIAPSCSLG